MADLDGLQRRLEELKALNLLDSGPEDEYDQITALAAQICETPISIISLLGTDRQYFKSRIGLEIDSTPIEQSFCLHTLDNPSEVAVVTDALADDRFVENPLVIGPHQFRFYAGAPLITDSGVPIGTLCVIDRVPRSIEPSQQEALKTLASQVTRLLELRRTRTELQRSQVELAEESIRLRRIIEATQIGTWEWNIKDDVVLINDHYAEIAGYTKAELEPANVETWYKLIHPDDRVMSDQKMNDCFDRKASNYEIECRLIRKDGQIVWVHDRGNVVSWGDDGKPLIMAGTITDITDKKNAELRLSLTLDSLKERIKEQTCLYRISQLYDSTVFIDDLLNKAVNIIPAGWRYPSKAHARILLGDKVFTGNGFSETPIYQTFSRYTIDGSTLQLEVFYDVGVPLTDDSPFMVEEWELLRMIVDNLVLFHDRKLAELRIMQNEKRYRNLVENGADALVILNADGTTQYVSPSITRVLGYSETEAMTLNLFEILHPADREPVAAVLAQVMDNPGQSMPGYTSRVLHKDGSWRWLEANITNWLHDPAINGIVDNFRDVTEQVISNKLDTLERSVMETSTDIQFDLAEVLAQYAKGLEEILPGLMVSVHGIVDGRLTRMAAPSLPEGYVNAIIGAKIGPVAGSCGTAAYRGKLVVVDDIATDPLWVDYKDLALEYGLRACWSQPIFDSDRNVIATIANYYSKPKSPGPIELEMFKRAAALLSLIMGSYRKNQELIASNERYHYVNLATNDAIYDWDVANDLFEWGESFTRLLGHKPADKPFKLADWASLMHPDDNARVSGLWDAFMADANHHIWKKEYRFQRSDGTYAYLEETGYLIRDRKGRPKRMIGVLRDQSATKEIELQKMLQHQISGIFSLEGSLAEILNLTCRHIAESIRCDVVEIWLSNADSSKLSKLGSHQVLKGGIIPDSIGSNDAINVTLTYSGLKIGSLVAKKSDPSISCDDVTRQLTALDTFLGSEIRRKQQEEEFRMFFDYAPEIMAIASPDGYFSKVNTAFCKLLGLDEQEIVYKPFSNFIHPDDIGGTMQEYDETISGSRRANNYLNRYKTKSGEYRWISWSSSAVYDENGYVFAYGRDVTERKKAEEALKKVNQQLEQHADQLAASNRELEHFAYIASHDLQEPLRMVTSFLSQLEKKYAETLDERAQKYIYYAVDGAKRMRQIILDLLEYSRVGTYEYAPEAVPLNELIDEVLHLDQSLIVEKKARVLAGDLPTVMCIRPPMVQVFHNLIVNAIKYSRPGVPPVIKISASDLGEYWAISVTDNGIGISEEYFEKIFVIFQRLHGPNEYGGTGLGLAIVKKVLDSIGGKVMVESKLGHGSTFKILIPKKPVSKP